MKLSKFLCIKGTIVCKTGLRIGGTKEGAIEAGGLENTIIRHPITDLPYLPGSSLKGKIRSLLELTHSARTQQTGNPCDCGICLVCKIFGSHSMSNKEITRLLVRDGALLPTSEEDLKNLQLEKGLNFTEIKTENIINRKTGIAANRGLRTQERVPEGSKFCLDMTLKLFDGDDEIKMVDFIKEGIELLQKDYLGSSGSRGYGKILVEGLEIKEC